MINQEEARQRSIDNDLHKTETYFEKRQINESHRVVENQARRPARQRVVDTSKPIRPNADQLDPVSGAIHWPAALCGDEYAEMRHDIGSFFGERIATHRGGAGTPNEQMLDRAMQAMHAMKQDLQKHIRELNSTDYVAASKFLKSLAYEAQSAPDNERVASR